LPRISIKVLPPQTTHTPRVQASAGGTSRGIVAGDESWEKSLGDGSVFAFMAVRGWRGSKKRYLNICN
jgi:hypothetical protein